MDRALASSPRVLRQVYYDLGARAHDMGDTAEALRRDAISRCNLPLQSALNPTACSRSHPPTYQPPCTYPHTTPCTSPLRLYQRADALNALDPLLLSNMGVAFLELSRPRDAFRCYRRALAADPHSVNARFNAGELLLEMGR